MSDLLQIRVYDQKQLVYTAEMPAPVVLGRQADGEAAPYSHRSDAQGSRLVLARLEEASVSRKHARLEWLPDGRLRLTNSSSALSIRLADGSEIKPTNSRDQAQPVLMTRGDRSVRVERPEDQASTLHQLPEATQAPQRTAGQAGPLSTLPLPGRDSPDLEAIVRSLGTTLEVLQSAAHAPDF